MSMSATDQIAVLAHEHPHILLVEDDPFVRDILEIYLAKEGYHVVTAGDGQEMRERMAQFPIALVLMDVRLPGEDGFTLTRHLREQHSVAIIILTTRHEIVDRVVGLECGADDYIIKPFEEREVLARIRSVLRRTASVQGQRPASAVNGRGLRFHGCTFDPDSGRLRARKGQDVMLTGNEGRLLTHLVQHAGEVQAREQLMTAVLQRAWSPLDRSIDVLITKLRQKVEDDPRHPEIIRTVRGAGYVVPTDPRAVAVTAA
jgi:DNA-binding response OmpR family regulator